MLRDSSQSPAGPLVFRALLLAGGASRRMGRDKAELLVGGEPLWQRQWRTLQQAGASAIAIARGPHARCEADGLIALPDAAEACGPLGGLVSGLRWAEGRLLVALAIDLPLMTPALLETLVAQAWRAGAGVVPMLDGRFEPLAAVYPAACLPLAEAALSERRLSLQDFVRGCAEAGLVQPWSVDEASRPCFLNLNSPANLNDLPGL